VKYDLLEQAMREVFGPPSITLADIERELRKAMRHDPIRAERAVGSLYGGVFKRKEAALNPWTRP